MYILPAAVLKEENMAYGNLCVRCGNEEENHIHNIINDPLTSENEWFYKQVAGYQLSCIECLETKWSLDYQDRVRGTHFDRGQFSSGYVSPRPEEESRLRQEDAERRLNAYRSWCAIVRLGDGSVHVIEIAD
jgi:hypothetical protein